MGCDISGLPVLPELHHLASIPPGSVRVQRDKVKMRSQFQLVPLLSLAGFALACQRDFHLEGRHTHRPPVARRAAEFPPVLTPHETILVNSFDNNSIDDWAQYYGHQNKLAGLGKDAAIWTRDRWAANGFKASLSEYEVYLSYPQHQALSIKYSNGTSKDVQIQEPALPEDDVTGRPDRVPTFHGYSASGSVSAEYIYVG